MVTGWRGGEVGGVGIGGAEGGWLMTSINLGFFSNWHSSLRSQALGLWHITTLTTQTHTHVHAHSVGPHPSIPAPFLLIPDHRRVAITQVFYRSFQRRKIRAIVSGWSYGQKLHSYWVHLCLWLRSLHTDGASLLGNGAFEGCWLGLRADAVPPHPLHPFQFPSHCHTNTHTHTPICPPAMQLLSSCCSLPP